MHPLIILAIAAIILYTVYTTVRDNEASEKAHKIINENKLKELELLAAENVPYLLKIYGKQLPLVVRTRLALETEPLTIQYWQFINEHVKNIVWEQPKQMSIPLGQ